MLDTVTRDDFANQLHTVFRLPGCPSDVPELELSQVSDRRTYRYNEVFSLVFRGPGDTLLQQQIYHLEHATLGTVDLFLVPIEKDGGAIYYEAVFNRLIPADR